MTRLDYELRLTAAGVVWLLAQPFAGAGWLLVELASRSDLFSWCYRPGNGCYRVWDRLLDRAADLAPRRRG